MRLNLYSFLLLVCSFFFLSHLSAQSFLGEEVDPRAYGINSAQDLEDPVSLRTRYVRIDPFEPGESLTLDLFPDAIVTAQRVRIEQHGDVRSWVGQIEDHPASYVIISQGNGGLFAKVVDKDYRQFLIARRTDGIYAVQEIQSSQLAESGDDAVVPGNEETPEDVPEAAGICDVGYSCSSKTVDLLIVYTSVAKTRLGGTNAAAESAINTAVAEMNTANTNSIVNHTFNLVHTQEVVYTETNSSSSDLSNLRNFGDGQLDDVHVLRYIHQADLVCLVTGTTSYCGRGYLQTNPTSFSASAGFNVSNYSCMTGNLTMAHEFGHNMGLRHDNFVDGSTTPCAHNHGYVNEAANPASANYTGNSSQRWRTIMAYNNQCTSWGVSPCSRLGYWSNPAVTRNTGTGFGPGSGVDPMGVVTTGTDPADNAYALNRGICLAADLNTQLTPLPVEFSSFSLTRDEQRFTLQWETLFELNNTGFEIQIRPEGEQNYHALGFVPGKGDSQEAQSYDFTTRNMLPGRYLFRIKQIDVDGQTSFSKLAEGFIPTEGAISLVAAPNPFFTSSTLEVGLTETQDISLMIYDGLGKEVLNLHSGQLRKGQYTFTIEGNTLKSGVYFYRLTGSDVLKAGKLVKY